MLKVKGYKKYAIFVYTKESWSRCVTIRPSKYQIKTITRDKEVHSITIKGSIHTEDIKNLKR